MEAISLSETLLTTYKNTRHHNPDMKSPVLLGRYVPTWKSEREMTARCILRKWCVDATGPEPLQITGLEFYYHSVNSTSHDNPDISECWTILDTSVVFDSIKVNIVTKNPVLTASQCTPWSDELSTFLHRWQRKTTWPQQQWEIWWASTETCNSKFVVTATFTEWQH